MHPPLRLSVQLTVRNNVVPVLYSSHFLLSWVSNQFSTRTRYAELSKEEKQEYAAKSHQALQQYKKQIKASAGKGQVQLVQHVSFLF